MIKSVCEKPQFSSSKETKMPKVLIIIFLLFTFILLSAADARAQTTEFNYQGQLQNSAVPANGSFDFEFLLFDQLSGGAQVGSTLSRNGVSVANGGFNVKLDFGSNFPGADRFLEIHVRQTGGGSFTPLTPRQAVSSVPYAVKSINAASADTVDAGNITGVLGTSQGGTGIGPALPVAGTFLRSNGKGWSADGLTTSDVPGGSANYIQNNNTNTAQAASNFNVSGTGKADIFNATTQYNLGGTRILSSGGTLNNLFAGNGSGIANINGINNSFVGAFSGYANQAGANNSFFGNSAGANNSGGNSNSFFGSSAGYSSAANNYNSFFGANAGHDSVGGGETFVGTFSGASDVTGVFNTIIGYRADVGSGGLVNATAIGANAVVGNSNTMVLGSITGIGGATNDTSVGIGTTAPSARLHVKTSGFNAVLGQSDGSGGVGVKGLGYVGVSGVSNNTSQPGIGVYAVSAGVSGGVGLRATGTSWFSGDTTPLNTSVVGSGTGVAIGSSPGVGYMFAIDYSDFSSKILALNSPGGRVGIGTLAPDQTLSVNGSASKTGGGSWLTFSDERLKNIGKNFRPGLKAAMQLQPLLYEYKAGNALGLRPDGVHVGFSAQAVQKLIPEAVTTDEKGYLLVNNDPIMWTMLNAIKEQQTQIEAQQKQIDEQNALNKKSQGEIESQQEQIRSLTMLVCGEHKEADVCKKKPE
jgi:hypothetical protein